MLLKIIEGIRLTEMNWCKGNSLLFLSSENFGLS